MNGRPRFLAGAITAGVLALAATVMLTLLSPFLGFGTVLRLAAPVLALAYLLSFLAGVGARTGRVVTLTLWGGLSVAAWWFVDSTTLYLLLHAGMLWLIRSLYAYRALIPALFDLAVTVLSVATFTWALTRTGSIFLATWCFFLVQALWTFIPQSMNTRATPTPADNAGFERARRRADTALRDLFSNSGFSQSG